MLRLPQGHIQHDLVLVHTTSGGGGGEGVKHLTNLVMQRCAEVLEEVFILEIPLVQVEGRDGTVILFDC